MTLVLRVRTPNGMLLDTPVERIVAEDLDGWFGIAPGRTDMVAALAPGLLSFRDGEGEGFVALEGGLLDLRSGRCRVMARQAVVSRRLDELTDRVDELLRARSTRRQVAAGALRDLVRVALERLAKEVR